MVNSILTNIIAGVGLLFSGLRMVDANLRQATGRQLWLWAARSDILTGIGRCSHDALILCLSTA